MASSSCANCNKTFDRKPGNRGFYRFSLENKLPHSNETAREALSSMIGESLTPVTIKRRGQFLCSSCWASLDDTARYHSAIQEFWGCTDDETYIGQKRKGGDSGDSIGMRKRPRFTSTPLKMDRFKGKRTKRRYLTNKKTYLWRGQEIQDVVQSPFKSPSKKKPKYSPSPYRAIGSSPQKTICSKIYTPKGKFGFPKKKNIKTGTKSKVSRPVDSNK